MHFQNKWDFLSEVDPVTLYYDVQDKLDGSINLNFMIECTIYEPSQMIYSRKAQEILNALIAKNDIKAINYFENHRYVDLLYQLRCKIAHELSVPGSVLSFSSDLDNPLPHYISCSRFYDINGKAIEDEIWELIIPLEFIEELLKNCFSNYLDYCAQNKKDPAENNKLERKFRVAWYD